MWSNHRATAFCSSTLPGFNPAIVAHDVSKASVSAEAVDIVEQTGTVINIGFAA